MTSVGLSLYNCWVWQDRESDSAGVALLLLALDAVQVDVVQLGVAAPAPQEHGTLFIVCEGEGESATVGVGGA